MKRWKLYPSIQYFVYITSITMLLFNVVIIDTDVLPHAEEYRYSSRRMLKVSKEL